MQSRSLRRRGFSPRSFLKLIRRARKALLNGQRDRAREYLRAALEILPSDGQGAPAELMPAILEASKVAAQLDGSKKLASLLREYVSLHTGNEDLWLALIGVLKAGNSSREALEACDEGIRACVDPSRILLKKAEMLLDQDKEEALEILWRLAAGERVPDKALALLEERGADAARIHLLRAGHHRRRGYSTLALEELDAALNQDPRCVEALEARALILGDEGRWEDALECVKEAIGIQSRRPLLWRLKSQAEEQLGQVEEAVRSLQVSLRYDPEDVPTMKRLGRLLLELRRREEACEVLETASTRAPRDAEALELWSTALREAKRWSEALRVLERLLALQPDRPDLLLQAAEAHVAEGQRERAGEMLEKLAKSAAPVQTLREASEVALKAELWEAALRASQAAAAQDRGDAHALKLQAQALMGLGRQEAALRALNRASRLRRDVEVLELKLGLLKSMRRHRAVYVACQDILRIDPTRLDVYLDMMDAALAMGKTAKALQVCDTALKHLPNSADLHLKRASILYDMGRFGEACRVYEEVTRLNPESFAAWKGYGMSLHALRSFPEAAQAFEAALRVQEDAECLHYMGLSLWEAGRSDQAVESLRRAAALSDQARSWLALGSCLLEEGRLQDALHALDRALELDPGSAEAFLRKAECLMGLGEHREAISVLDEGLKLHGEDPDLLYARVQCLQEVGRPQEAYDSAVALTERTRQDPQAWILRADVAAALGLTTEALDCLKAASRLLPRDPTPRLREVSILLAAGDYDAALEVCDEATRLDRANGPAHRLRGEALAALDRHEEALMAFEQALALDREDLEALRGKAVSLARLERHQEALQSVDALLSRSPSNPMSHYWKAVVLAEAKSWEEALASLNQALYYGGSSPNVIALKGRVLLEMGRGEEGLKLVEDALSGHPEQQDLVRTKVSILLALARPQEALQQADAVLSKRNRDWELWMLRAESLAALGWVEEATESLEMAIRSGRPTKGLWLRSSSLYLKLGHEEASLACYDQAIALDPRDAELWISKARLCETLGRWREAVESYSSALEIRPRDEGILCALGRGYVHLGLYEEALNAYQEALATNPTSEEALKGTKEVEERRREDRVKAYAWRVLEFEAVNERPATKEEIFKHCNVPMDLLDEVVGYVNEPPPLDVLSLPEQELRRLETLSREVLSATSGLGLPRLSQVVQECPYVDPHEAREVLGYVKGVLEMDTPVDHVPGLERLMKMALDLPREEWNTLSLAKSLRIGVYEAKRLEAALRIFQERSDEGAEVHRPPSPASSGDGRTCRKHGATGIYEHFCGQYLCSACIVGGKCPVCRHPVSRALSGFRAQEGSGTEIR